jgi:uncharacterized protein YndB with AHSA1/START domain
MMIKIAAIACLLFWAPVSAWAEDGAITNCSHVEADGTRTLCHEAVLPSSADAIWPLLSTTGGLSSWVAPVAAIDLRVGGIWEVSYRADGRLGDAHNIRNRVLSYLPGRMLSVIVDQAPLGFPQPELVRTVWTVIEIEPLSATQSRVRVSMLGYGTGADYDQLYALFDEGNAYTLQKLRERVSSGPTDWHAPAAAIASGRR